MRPGTAPIVLATLLAGCTAAGVRGTPSIPVYNLDVERTAQGFHVRFTSLDSRAICLPSEQWPTRLGWVEAAATILELTVDGRVYAGSGDYGRYCPRGCPPLVVMPGETLTTSLGFDNFVGLDAGVAENSQVDLKYGLEPFRCRARREK